jgi:hypothetical protein
LRRNESAHESAAQRKDRKRAEVSEGVQIPHQLGAGESEGEAQGATSLAKNAAEYSFRKEFLLLALPNVEIKNP